MFRIHICKNLLVTIDTRKEITLNIKFNGIKGDRNIQQSLKFSPWCLAEEVAEQIVPFFLKQDIIECMKKTSFSSLSATLCIIFHSQIVLLATPTETETNFMSYSLFLGETYLHKDKSLVELQLEDGVCLLYFQISHAIVQN